MVSAVSQCHQVKAVESCYMRSLFSSRLAHFQKPKNHPDCLFLPSMYMHFLLLTKIHFTGTRFVLLKGLALMIAQTVTHLSLKGRRILDMKSQDDEGYLLFTYIIAIIFKF